MTGRSVSLTDYSWGDAQHTSAHAYVLPALDRVLKDFGAEIPGERVLDLGCGNGAVTGWLAARSDLGDVVGVDPSAQGLKQARSAHPALRFYRASAYDPLHRELGTFSLAVSLEVVEHVYDPATYAGTLYDVLEPGGIAVLSTPYHGWLKNVLIAVLGKFDEHVDPLRLHGHIKFWSVSTLSRLLEDAGFDFLDVRFAGRIRPVAKSMLVVARRPIVREKSVSGDS